MSKAKKIITTILGVVLVVGVCTGAYFFYESTNYYTTDNASVTANMINIMPAVSGNIATWDVHEGEKVKKGQVLGKVDVSTLVNSNSINKDALETNADSILSKAEIKSPIEGTIEKSNVLKGVTVSQANTVAVVADTSDFFIKANVEETDIFKIKVGQKVSVKIDAYPRKQFEGYVEMISPATQSAFSQISSINTSGTFSKVTQLIPIKITLVNDGDLPMLIGMNATVKIKIK